MIWPQRIIYQNVSDDFDTQVKSTLEKATGGLLSRERCNLAWIRHAGVQDHDPRTKRTGVPATPPPTHGGGGAHFLTVCFGWEGFYQHNFEEGGCHADVKGKKK